MTPQRSAETAVPRRILVPLDLAEDSRAAFDQVSEFAARIGAKMRLLHVAGPAESSRDGEEQLRELVSAAREFAPRLAIETEVRTGSITAAICEAARDAGADFIALTTREHTDLRHVLFGGTVEGVIRQAPCPTLVFRCGAVRSRARVREAEPYRLLVCVDFSEASIKAVRYAAALAASGGGCVSLVHILDKHDDLMAMTGGDVSQISADASARLDAVMKREVPAPLHCGTYIRHGEPFAQIAATADLHHADLLVLTTHSRSGFAYLLLGSTAAHVMHHCDRNVLVLPSGPG